MKTVGAAFTLVAVSVMGMPVVGCVARISETRLYGAAHPAADAVSRTLTQRQVGIDGTPECRDVVVTDPMVREVQIRRSFADDAQERNAAIASLLGGGIGLIAYGQDSVVCPGNGGRCSDPTLAGVVLLGLAAIPIGFLAFNANAVRDGRVVERAPPDTAPQAWRSCSSSSSLP
jgi:hypothetical protein